MNSVVGFARCSVGSSVPCWKVFREVLCTNFLNAVPLSMLRLGQRGEMLLYFHEPADGALGCDEDVRVRSGNPELHDLVVVVLEAPKALAVDRHSQRVLENVLSKLRRQRVEGECRHR